MDAIIEMLISLFSGTFSLLIFGIGFLWAIAAYVMGSLGLYTIAKRRGLRAPGLAWVPVLSVWTLGSISDHYRQVTAGEKRNRRKLLLVLNIVRAVLFIPVFILVVLLFSAVLSILLLALWGWGEEVQWGGGTVPPAETGDTTVLGILLLVGLGSLMVYLALSVVVAVFKWIATYDVFKSCDPINAPTYLLVSLLVSLLAGFRGLDGLFLMLCMKKDEGMPPMPEALPPEAEEAAEPEATEE